MPFDSAQKYGNETSKPGQDMSGDGPRQADKGKYRKTMMHTGRDRQVGRRPRTGSLRATGVGPRLPTSACHKR